MSPISNSDVYNKLNVLENTINSLSTIIHNQADSIVSLVSNTKLLNKLICLENIIYNNKDTRPINKPIIKPSVTLNNIENKEVKFIKEITFLDNNSDTDIVNYTVEYFCDIIQNNLDITLNTNDIDLKKINIVEPDNILNNSKSEITVNKINKYNISFKNLSDKISLLKNKNKFKGTNLFINDILTKTNTNIFYNIRNLRKNDNILNTWTYKGCRYIYIKFRKLYAQNQ